MSIAELPDPTSTMSRPGSWSPTCSGGHGFARALAVGAARAHQPAAAVTAGLFDRRVAGDGVAEAEMVLVFFKVGVDQAMPGIVRIVDGHGEIGVCQAGP